MTLLAALAVALTLEPHIAALAKSGAICSAGAVKTFFAATWRGAIRESWRASLPASD